MVEEADRAQLPMRAPRSTVHRARHLRREMTLPEVLLWRDLRRRQLGGLLFRRQHPFGPYVLDFFCPEHGARASRSTARPTTGPSRAARDERRDLWLTQQGVRVLRFRAADVLSDASRVDVLRPWQRLRRAASPSSAMRRRISPLQARPMTPYFTLERLFARLRALGDAAGILGWDAQTLMPTGAAEGRAEQLATLRGLAHELLVAPATADLLAAAEADARPRPLAGRQPARDAPRPRPRRPPCPATSSRPSPRPRPRPRWRGARPARASDFALLRPAPRRGAAPRPRGRQAKGEALGLAPYDALLDQYDPGLAPRPHRPAVRRAPGRAART